MQGRGLEVERHRTWALPGVVCIFGGRRWNSIEQYKPRDKITQKMTRDGLTEQNQTTGESERISKGYGLMNW